MRISVLLPAPFGPSRPKISPSATSKLTPFTASKSPYFFTMFSTAIAASALRRQRISAWRDWLRACDVIASPACPSGCTPRPSSRAQTSRSGLSISSFSRTVLMSRLRPPLMSRCVAKSASADLAITLPCTVAPLGITTFEAVAQLAQRRPASPATAHRPRSASDP